MSKRKPRPLQPGEFADRDGNRLPKYMQLALARLRSGETLCKEVSPLSSVPRFFLDPSEREMSPGTAYKVIQSGYVVPGRDGLFGGDDQTWRFANG